MVLQSVVRLEKMMKVLLTLGNCKVSSFDTSVHSLKYYRLIVDLMYILPACYQLASSLLASSNYIKFVDTQTFVRLRLRNCSDFCWTYCKFVE